MHDGDRRLLGQDPPASLGAIIGDAKSVKGIGG
jgi:hypothetical protein